MRPQYKRVDDTYTGICTVFCIFYFVFNGIVDVVMGRIEKRMDYYQ